MAIKLTSPLFSDSASGKLSKFGTFRKLPSGLTILCDSYYTNNKSGTPDSAKKAHFASAVALYKLVPKQWILRNNKRYFVRQPHFGAWFNNWLISNPWP